MATVQGLQSLVDEYKIAEEAYNKAIQIDEKSVEACGHLAQVARDNGGWHYLLQTNSLMHPYHTVF
ncbi:hypothetical protein R6Q59_033408 [Mikania micrantha]